MLALATGEDGSERRLARAGSSRGSVASSRGGMDATTGAKRSSWGSTAHVRAQGNRTWDLRKDWVPEPRYHTKSQMQETRAAAMMPHHTFDVDGDGVVSQEDFRMSSQFDINKDGIIQLDERHELRKQMVDVLIKKYRRLP